MSCDPPAKAGIHVLYECRDDRSLLHVSFNFLVKNAKVLDRPAEKRSMPKEKILYICDEKHNSQDAPLELKESVPYPENLNYGEKDSVHYYYQCPTCSRVSSNSCFQSKPSS